MDNIIIWVALIGIIGTLGGVWLGNWLQSRNIKRQRDWMLQDQKREWLRRQRGEEFERILGYVEGALEYVLKAEWILQFSSEERKEELVFRHAEQAALAMPIVYTTMSKDKELADLLFEFAQKSKDVTSALLAKDHSKLDITGQRIAEIAGLIRQRINKLLEETFD